MQMPSPTGGLVNMNEDAVYVRPVDGREFICDDCVEPDTPDTPTFIRCRECGKRVELDRVYYRRVFPLARLRWGCAVRLSDPGGLHLLGSDKILKEI